MRTTVLSPVVVISLLVVTISLAVSLRIYRSDSTANHQAVPNPSDIFTVLQAHSGHSHQEWLRFAQQGTLVDYTATSAASQHVSESRLKLAADHSFVKYDKATLNRNQSFVFDGYTMLCTTLEGETRLEVKVLGSAETTIIRFQAATFGLLPILGRLSDPNTQVFYDGAASNGNRFQVKTVNGSWYFYTNPNDLIDRLEIKDLSITYEDYRTVDGLNLPFFERVKKGNRLMYEIKFDTFDLNPVFTTASSPDDLR